MKLTVLSVLLTLLLAGCSWLPDHTGKYREVATLEPMTVPEDMVFLGRDDHFTVPNPELRLYPEKKRSRFVMPPPPSQLGEEASLAAAPAEAALDDMPDPQRTRIVLSRDGNDFPIIMIYTRFEWAWEYVGNGLGKTDLKITDRSRDLGVYYVTLPRRLSARSEEFQIKLSHTVNGVQVAFLNQKGSALADKSLGDTVLQLLYDQL